MSDDKHTLTFTNTTRASVPTQSHPVEFYGLPTRCEPPNLAVKGCTVHNTVTLDLALVRALVEALEAMQAAVKDLPPSSVLRLSDDLVTRFLRADGKATAMIARAKEAGL